jgi:predicted transcriptional regulator
MVAMSRLLDRALAKVRELPEEDQDALAIALLAMADAKYPVAEMDDQTRAAVREGLEQARRGESVSDADIQALWKRHGL